MPSRIQVEWTGLAGSPYLTTWYFDDAGVATPQALADAVNATLNQFRGFVTTALAFGVLPEVTTYTTPDQPTGTVAVSTTTVNGTVAAAPLARATQGLIRWRTGAYRGAREVQGRTFLPGPTVTQLDAAGGVPTATYRTAMQNLATDLIAAGLTLPSRTANAFYPVTSAAPWNQFAVLRSRRD